MAQIVKSVLFFDYDSVYRSLHNRDGSAGERFAGRAAAWLAALETGALIAPRPDEPRRRRILVKRCYADPKLLGGNNRSALIGAGFQVVDCPTLAGRSRNAADISMVLDTIDALEHATGFEEFIILSAEADLSPMLFRLRAHNRASVIYAEASTAEAYRAFADATIDEAALIDLLHARQGATPASQPGKATEAQPVYAARSAQSQPTLQPQREVFERPRPATAEAPPQAASSREELAALVKRIHVVTNVPLFSPRTFADFFRLLATEVSKYGYRFQETAEKVTDELVSLGRNVTRRQVGFVVKGLALRGHVFGAGDTPEELAEVFREQVVYLLSTANVTLTDRETALLRAWIAGRAMAQLPPPSGSRNGFIDAESNAAFAAPLAPEPEAEPEPERDPQPVEFRPVPDPASVLTPTTAEAAPARRTAPRPMSRVKLADMPPPPKIELTLEKSAPLSMTPPEPFRRTDSSPSRSAAERTPSRPAAESESRPERGERVRPEPPRPVERPRTAAERMAAERLAAERQAAERIAADRQAAERAAAEERARERQAAERDAAERQAAQRQAAERESARRESEKSASTAERPAPTPRPAVESTGRNGARQPAPAAAKATPPQPPKRDPAERLMPRPPTPRRPAAEATAPEPARSDAAAATATVGEEDMESSLLAAIAEAMDVMVDDEEAPDEIGDAIRNAVSSRGEPEPAATPHEAEEAFAAEGEAASDEIGDEIQRILSTYNQGREQRR